MPYRSHLSREWNVFLVRIRYSLGSNNRSSINCPFCNLIPNIQDSDEKKLRTFLSQTSRLASVFILGRYATNLISRNLKYPRSWKQPRNDGSQFRWLLCETHIPACCRIFYNGRASRSQSHPSAYFRRKHWLKHR